ncbi:hypothetical protein CKO15_05820 [Halorhodospira abdelmalekii]|uniref:NAD(P)H-hydrate dehydratase n=1 Tax=Halorhodospira abdelmalekii TaxID=421629 RepID=UPI00190402D2|nr:NAD(P)H-hydrate dehydratase [Halorhodospira abdelmalekii]MBK1734812.1 hypothetical protein [Halorhodospira abdelmalekii]
MPHLPRALYTPEQVRELDRLAIESGGIPGERLMERAGQRAYALIRARWPSARRLRIFCGGGNNGGDGYIVARLAATAGLDVEVYCLCPPEQLRGDAARAAKRYLETGAPCYPFVASAPPPPSAESAAHGSLQVPMREGTVFIDALLGTGLDRPVSGDYAAAIAAMNADSAPVLAIDIPSGLHGRTGAVLGCAVQADATATFVGLKSGLLTGRGPALCGQLFFDDLGTATLLATLLEDRAEPLEPYAERIDAAILQQTLRRRPRDAHKGLYGHVLIVGGGAGMAGAARLAGEAALRSGAGLVSVATRPEHVAAIVTARPELMVHGITQPAELTPLLERCSVLVLGPGLGTDAWGEALWLACREWCRDWPGPTVIDADGLNLLARYGDLASYDHSKPSQSSESSESSGDHSRNRRDDNEGLSIPTAGLQHATILTPHPGEAARLLATDTATINADRFAAARALQQRAGPSGVAILKGAGTLVEDGQRCALSDTGNPGMASAGMGDLLSGILGGLLAQGLSPAAAARCAVYLHGCAGDRAAAKHGERGLLASDLFDALGRLIDGRPRPPKPFTL